MQVFARLRLADVVHADLVQNLPGYVQAEASLWSVQLVLRSRSFLLSRLTQSYLFQDSHEELVDVVLNSAGGLDELAVSWYRQSFTIWNITQGEFDKFTKFFG